MHPTVAVSLGDLEEIHRSAARVHWASSVSRGPERRALVSPVRPCVPITITSARLAFAKRTIRSAGTPTSIRIAEARAPGPSCLPLCRLGSQAERRLAWRHMHGLLGARACPSGAGWSHLPWDAVTKTQRKCPPHHAALPRHRGHAPCTPSRAWVGRRDNGGSALMWGVLALACKLVVNGRAKFAGLLTGVTVRC